VEELKRALAQLEVDVSEKEFSSLMAWLDLDGNAQVQPRLAGGGAVVGRKK
jgi:hypothetical protein